MAKQLDQSNPPIVIGNPLVEARAAIPHDLHVEDGLLCWRRETEEEGPSHGFREGGSVVGALWDFIRLDTKSDDEILSFARRYGVLAIRSDALPGITPTRDPAVNLYPDQIDIDGTTWFREPLNAWRMYAFAARSILALAHEISVDPSVNPLDVITKWDLTKTIETFGFAHDSSNGFNNQAQRIWLYSLNPQVIAHNLKRVGPDHVRNWLSAFVTDMWIRRGTLMPMLTWSDNGPRMELSLGTGHWDVVYPNNMLFSVLAAQMAAVVSSSSIERMAVCSVCGDTFEATIKPGRHTRTFCQKAECQLEGERSRKRKWARKRAALRSNQAR